jgi:hypothetical protein
MLWHDALLALHIFGLMLGAAGGMSSAFIMARAAKSPPEHGLVLRGLGPHLARIAGAGLIVMWISGVALVFLTYGSFDRLPALFWVKFVFISTLTLAAIAVEVSYAHIKAGKMKPPGLLLVLGPISGVSALLAMIVAVFTFH